MRSLSNKRITRRRRRVASTLAVAIVTFGLAIGGIAAFADGGSSGDPDFAVAVNPSTRIVYLGTTTSYGIKVTRLNGFTGPVRLRVWHLPPGTTATWRLSDGTESDVLPAGLDRASVFIRTSWTTRIGTRAMSIGGTAYDRLTGTRITHSADVTLTVQRLFQINGRLPRPLYPGVGVPLNLRLTNPNDFPVNVTAVAVRVAQTDRVGCGTDNFRVRQMPPSVYPITLQPGESRTLHQLGLSNPQVPGIRLRETGQNQDACKGAQLTLSYRGRGTR